ncbi:MAG: UvrD-helicase domain-containing protein [candidate division WOR-3 bacterium]
MIKSKIVLSPAGSGKTERLAQRYIELLENGVLPERILTITFTEKAAAEMKARILQILKEKNPDAYKKILEKSFLLRIQTIDSFCYSLLRRFAHLCGYEYDLEVLPDSSYLQRLSIAGAMSKIEKLGPDSQAYQDLLSIITNKVNDKQFQGWKIIEELFEALYAKHISQERIQLAPIERLSELPQIIEELKNHPITNQKIENFTRLILDSLENERIEEIKKNLEEVKGTFLQKSGNRRTNKKNYSEDEWYQKMFNYYLIVNQLSRQIWLKQVLDLFKNYFLEEFYRLKKENNVVDFADLEILTYKILTEDSNWANILYFFDEHTDHILVDEFQDTSFLQWAIIKKLTEEWFSGLGIKQERQIKPTIFLVGDDKQSIYMFRNAHAEIFNYAKSYLEKCLKDEFDFEEVTSNYRSLRAIIDFTNRLFSQLMSPDPQYMSRKIIYKPFECKRNNSNCGIVEIILIPTDGAKKDRRKEAETLAKKILSIVNAPIVYNKEEKPQQAKFRDIAVLLRSRTYLDIYEQVFREYRIPFVVIKGIGFYSSLEISLLRELLNVLVNPDNDYSLYVILKSPIFGFTEKELLKISQYQYNGMISSLWRRLQTCAANDRFYKECVEKLTNWVSAVGQKPIGEIIREIFDTQNMWNVFWEDERAVNIKKFLVIVEELEKAGLSPVSITDYFEKATRNTEEPKANVNTEGRDVVKIMTIHAAKGLQFPIVFLPALDKRIDNVEQNKEDAKLIITEKDDTRIIVAYEPESGFRKLLQIYKEIDDQEAEEEKRIFYVGVTRARDVLYLSGIDKVNSNPSESWLNWLKIHLGINYNENKYRLDKDYNIKGLSITTDREIHEFFVNQNIELPQIAIAKKESYIQELLATKDYEWRVVTEELPEVSCELRRKHGEYWLIIGEILHKIFEALSRGLLSFRPDEIVEFTQKELLSKYFLIDSTVKSVVINEIKRQMSVIETSEILEIIMPPKTNEQKAFCELPFIFTKNGTIYSGRVDRVIIDQSGAFVYDYKTFPVTDKEIPALINSYRKQIKLYEGAIREIFSVATTRGFLIFTAIGKIREVL